MGLYTVRLEDQVYGRVVLDEVSSDTPTHAITAAVAAPGVNAGSGSYSGTQVVDQSVTLGVSGKDTSGNPIVAPTQLPVNPPTFSTAHL